MSKGKKLTIAEVSEYVASRGFVLLSDKYENNKTKVKLCCPAGHFFETTFRTFKESLVGCPFCAGNKKYAIFQVRNIFESRGFTLVSDKYTSSKDKLEYVCPRGHRGKINLHSFKNGTGCSLCPDKRLLPQKTVEDAFSLAGYTLLDKYTGYNTPLSFIGYTLLQRGKPPSSGGGCKRSVNKKTYKYLNNYFTK